MTFYRILSVFKETAITEIMNDKSKTIHRKISIFPITNTSIRAFSPQVKITILLRMSMQQCSPGFQTLVQGFFSNVGNVLQPELAGNFPKLLIHELYCKMHFLSKFSLRQFAVKIF